ncbi:MAG: sugar-binding domain-containing protein [Verrucomicrobiota bacterium]
MKTLLKIIPLVWLASHGAMTIAASTAAAAAASDAAAPMALAGAWQFQLDPQDAGLAERWFGRPLPGQITLPTTTDLAGFGDPEPDPNPGFLSREHKFIGPAWYRREVTIPDAWRDREVELLLERVLWESRVWVDERECGAQDSLGTPHLHRLGKLAAGRHTLTLRIDNRMIHPLGDRGHCYTDFTQTIWNGALGRLELRARPELRLDLVRVFPDAGERRVGVELTVANATNTAVPVDIQLTLRERGGTRALASASFRMEAAPGTSLLSPHLDTGFSPQTWDEFSPQLYDLDVRLGSGPSADSATTGFGFRTLTRDGNRLQVNGRPTFLRGNLDCAQYPLTGHPPMTVEGWRRVFGVCRQYGLNHIRFHSWCPPEAAFTAADEMGFYLLAEVLWIDGWMGSPNSRKDMDTPGHPKGVGKGDRTIDDYARAEMRRMLDAYGNHPSFCFFAIGNELGSSDFKIMGEWIKAAKTYDPRRFYAASTARTITPADDFSDTHNIPGIGGVVNSLGTPSTDWDYEASYHRAPVPIIAHEMGQMPVYPNWSEIAKYTGPLRAKSYELFRAQARTNGVADQSADFQAASGAMNRLIYKNEMEAQLRSPGCAGVSWLSLQDFPGQGEALVGWLDTLYESKGFVTPQQFCRYSAATVPLARFAKFVWTSDETFTATAQVSHWGSQPIADARVGWTLRDAKHAVVAKGDFAPTHLAVGSVTTLGKISAGLSSLTTPQKLSLELSLAGTPFANDWDLWVFPATAAADAPANVLVTENPAAAWDALAGGGRVLLLAQQLGDKSTQRNAAWMPLFWSSRFFPGQDRDTLGALVQPRHPALAHFPTDGHLDWQWREICDGARGFVLDAMPADYRPIVQPVSDYHFNHKLAAIFELATADGGRLLVCGYDLANRLNQRPAARQLRTSLLAYAGGSDFTPKQAIAQADFMRLFPVVAGAPVVKPPPGFDGAVLSVHSAARHPASGDALWRKDYDDVKVLADGYGYSVHCDGIWKDGTGTAWFGGRIKVEVKMPTAILGDLFVRFHDWNNNGRTANLTLEGRQSELGRHTQGAWVKLDVLREDANDGTLTFEAECTSGPNIQITDFVLVPRH